MACCCKVYPPIIRATTVATTAGVTTITIPTTSEIISGGVYNILLATTIPNGTDGTQLIITNGTVTGSVFMGNGNYFRPLPLRSRTVLTVQYLDDPNHFQILPPPKRR